MNEKRNGSNELNEIATKKANKVIDAQIVKTLRDALKEKQESKLVVK